MCGITYALNQYQLLTAIVEGRLYGPILRMKKPRWLAQVT